MTNMKRSTKSLVDIFKFVFSISIVLLHYNIFAAIPFGSTICALVVRLAVPYFFIAAGYFWSKKIHTAVTSSERKNVTTSYCKRLGVKLLILEPISIALVLIDSFLRHKSIVTTGISIIQNILFYPYGSLWYIQAVIVAVLLLIPIVYRKKELLAIIPALILYILGTLGNRYYFLIDDTVIKTIVVQYEKIFVCTRNGLFFGFPFVLLGCIISRFETFFVKQNRFHRAIIIAFFVFFYGLCCFEHYLVQSYCGHNDNAMYLSYFFVVPLLFIITIQPNRFTWSTVILRNLSTSVYLIHRPIGVAIEYIFNHFHIDSIALTASIGIMVVALVCWVVYRTKRQPFYDWLT